MQIYSDLTITAICHSSMGGNIQSWLSSGCKCEVLQMLWDISLMLKVQNEALISMILSVPCFTGCKTMNKQWHFKQYYHEWVHVCCSEVQLSNVKYTNCFCSCGQGEFMDNVIRKVIAAREINHKGQGLWVSLKVLPGDLKQVGINSSKNLPAQGDLSLCSLVLLLFILTPIISIIQE